MSDNKVQKIGVLTSGGDAPGMNAAIRAVVRACIYHDITPYGIREGYEGLIQNDMYRMEAGSVKHIVHQGGTILKSARCKFFYEKEGRERSYRNLTSRGIEALVVIGGDGTFKGVKRMNEEFGYPVIGIPGTIDNDIYGTDFTIGFDTATNTVVQAVDQIRDTATSHNRLFFIEVMGRDSGYIVYSFRHSGRC
ncbi:MAG: ATP-dependent 6-phosphofructokinase [Balneolaceae bacterium]|nr:ATP-dependent 6-phosphofructokinase [Balneolaceae bacterium]